MKRLVVMLAVVWLMLSVSCAASTFIPNAGISQQAAGSGNDNNAVPVPATTINGDTLLFCFLLNSQTVTTLGGTFSSCTNFTTLDSVTNGSANMKCGCRIASSEPSSYTPTWTGSSTSIGEILDLKNTDGTTPLIDVHTATAGQPYSQVTTTVNNDVILVPMLGNLGNTGQISGGQNPFGTALNVTNAQLLIGGQQTAGVTSVPAAITFTGSGASYADVIAVKSNTTTAANFHGIGASGFNSGAATVVTLGLPTNINATDVALADIVEDTPGVAITVPLVSDIQPRFLPTNVVSPSSSTYVNNTSGTASNSITLPSNLVAGDQIVCMSDWNTTQTLSSGPAGFTQYFSDSTRRTFNVWTKAAVSGDIGATKTVTASGSVSITFACQAFYSMSGATVSVDTHGTFAGAASGTSITLNAVTTTNANELVLPIVVNNVGTTLTFTPPSTVGAALSAAVTQQGTAAIGILMYAQSAAGASATPAVSTTSGIWATVQIALATNTHAAGPVWTHQTPFAVKNEAGTVQTDVYSMPIPSNGGGSAIQTAMQFPFGSSESSSDGVITAWSNVNTTTPIDVSSGLANEGEQQTQQAPIHQPTPNDELAVSFNGYSSICSPSGTRGGQYPTPLIGSTSGRLSVYYQPINTAVAAQAVDSCAGPHASWSGGLESATTPARTTANVDINQHVIEIFSTTAPNPPVSAASPFELEIP